MNLHGSDPAFAEDSRVNAEQVKELAEYCRLKLGVDVANWRLVSSRVKLKKILFEIEDSSRGKPRYWIGKMTGSPRRADQRPLRQGFESLETLWHNGMRPPSRFTVAEPAGYFDERNVLLQEKAPGVQLIRLIQSGEATAEHARSAAEWILCLQSLHIDVPPLEKPDWNLQACRAELPSALPGVSKRTEAVMEQIAASIVYDGKLVPSHGDFHPMNVFIAPDRVTAIDLDTFACREPAADPAYFLAQTAIMGYMTWSSFGSTERFRRAFEDALGPRDSDRMAVHLALALIRTLHYDFCILHSDPHHLVEPFVAAAERCVFEGAVDLAA